MEPLLVVKPPSNAKDENAKERSKKILRELSVLCNRGGEVGSVPAKTFAEFLRSHVHNEDAASEVQELVERLNNDRQAEAAVAAEGSLGGRGEHSFEASYSMASSSPALVILKSGAIISSRSSNVRFTKASALAFVSLKLRVMTEDSQEADKAQLQGDIESLEKMLAQMEGEEVQLRAMLQPSMLQTLVRSSSVGSTDAAGSGDAAASADAAAVQDVTPFGVQQKLASLFKLRQKAREMCGSDSEDEDLAAAPSRTNRPHGGPSYTPGGPSPHGSRPNSARKAQDRLLTPKEKAEVREKRYNLLAYVAEGVSKLTSAVGAELDRRMQLISDANSFADQREQAIEALRNKKLVRNMHDLEPILANSSRMRKTACVKDLLEAKRMVRAAKQQMRLPDMTLLAAAEEEEEDLTPRQIRDLRINKEVHAKDKHTLWSDPRASVQGTDLSGRLAEAGAPAPVADAAPASAPDSAAAPVSAAVAQTIGEPAPGLKVTAVTPAPAPARASVVPLLPIGNTLGELSSSTLHHLTKAIPHVLPNISPTIFGAQLGDVFTRSDYVTPLTQEERDHDPFGGPKIDTLIRNSREWPPRHIVPRTNFSGLFFKHDGTEDTPRNSNGDTPSEDTNRRIVHAVKAAAERVVVSLASALSKIVRLECAKDNGVQTMLGALRSSRQEGFNAALAIKAESDLRNVHVDRDQIVLQAPNSILRACVAGSIGGIISTLEAKAAGEQELDRSTAAREYIRQIDLYFHLRWHRNNPLSRDSSASAPSSPRSSRTSTARSSSSKSGKVAAVPMTHEQKMKHEYGQQQQLNKVREERGEEESVSSEMQHQLYQQKQQAAEAHKQHEANKKQDNVLHSAWSSERQTILLLSWLPEGMVEDVLLSRGRYSVPVLVCAAWVHSSEHRPCLARELLLWLARALEFEAHSVDSCPSCNHTLTACYKDALGPRRKKAHVDNELVFKAAKQQEYLEYRKSKKEKEQEIEKENAHEAVNTPRLSDMHSGLSSGRNVHSARSGGKRDHEGGDAVLAGTYVVDETLVGADATGQFTIDGIYDPAHVSAHATPRREYACETQVAPIFSEVPPIAHGPWSDRSTHMHDSTFYF